MNIFEFMAAIFIESWLTFAVAFVLLVWLVSLMACRALTPLARRGWRPILSCDDLGEEMAGYQGSEDKIFKNRGGKFENFSR